MLVEKVLRKPLPPRRSPKLKPRPRVMRPSSRMPEPPARLLHLRHHRSRVRKHRRQPARQPDDLVWTLQGMTCNVPPTQPAASPTGFITRWGIFRAVWSGHRLDTGNTCFLRILASTTFSRQHRSPDAYAAASAMPDPAYPALDHPPESMRLAAEKDNPHGSTSY